MARGNKRVLLQCPTGGGKTVTFSEIVLSAHLKGKRVYCFVHRKELIEQISGAFSNFGIPHGVVSPDWAQTRHKIQIISVASWRTRKDKLPEPDLICMDEAHHLAAKTWGRIVDAYPDAYVLGVTATPERLDGKGLRKHMDALVLGPSVRWLINEGWLSKYKMYSVPPRVDVDKLRTKMGDYDQQQLAREIKRSESYGEIVGHYNRYLPGKQALAFACNIEDSKTVVEKFQEAGIKAAHLDGTTPKKIRHSVMQRFRQREIQVVSNVELFGEGVDIPDLDGVIMLRPTKSLAIYLQQIGRALRPSEGKDAAIIIDHVGNFSRHGHPCAERKWSLDGKQQREKRELEVKEKLRICPHCFATMTVRGRSCPYSGMVLKLDDMGLIEVRGELVEIGSIKHERHKKAKLKEDVRKAHTYQDFVNIGKRMGYKPGWAKYKYNAVMQYRGRRSYRDVLREAGVG